MTIANQGLADRVVTLRDHAAGFSPAVADAMRLADAYADIEPELYTLPVTQGLGSFRANNANAMLYRTAPDGAFR